MKGYIHSFQSLGASDGPGVRFVVFMQGCNLRCGCCHNPDTWECGVGQEFDTDEVITKILRCREYFGKDGGVTVSGGEPLLQAGFVKELFDKCHENGINTCLDTSGSILNDDIKKLLSVTDRVLLDIKYTNDVDYKRYVGCDLNKPLRFLQCLDERNIPTWIRQVIIPTLNDDDENIERLNAIVQQHKNVDKVELLPFHKICSVKYDKMGIEFPFGHLNTPTKEQMDNLKAKLK